MGGVVGVDGQEEKCHMTQGEETGIGRMRDRGGERDSVIDN